MLHRTLARSVWTFTGALALLSAGCGGGTATPVGGGSTAPIAVPAASFATTTQSSAIGPKGGWSLR